MSEQLNLPYLFESSIRSTPAWIDKGRGLLGTSEILNKELLELLEKHLHEIPDDIEQQLWGLIDGVLLLAGFSIENAIKGLIVANKPDFENINDLDNFKFNSKGGHGIKEMVIHNIDNLTFIELDLLERPQETILWAGRYNSPRNTSKTNINSLHPSFGDKDFKNCSALFHRIESIANEKWNQNENLYWIWCDKYESSIRK